MYLLKLACILVEKIFGITDVDSVTVHNTAQLKKRDKVRRKKREMEQKRKERERKENKLEETKLLNKLKKRIDTLCNN